MVAAQVDAFAGAHAQSQFRKPQVAAISRGLIERAAELDAIEQLRREGNGAHTHLPRIRETSYQLWITLAIARRAPVSHRPPDGSGPTASRAVDAPLD